jgi:hypothetical protein
MDTGAQEPGFISQYFYSMKSKFVFSALTVMMIMGPVVNADRINSEKYIRQILQTDECTSLYYVNPVLHRHSWKRVKGDNPLNELAQQKGRVAAQSPNILPVKFEIGVRSDQNILHLSSMRVILKSTSQLFHNSYYLNDYGQVF